MPQMRKSRAMHFIRKAQLDFLSLGPPPLDKSRFDEVYRYVRVCIERVFGEESSYVREFHAISFYPSLPPDDPVLDQAQNEQNRRVRMNEQFIKGYQQMNSLLSSLLKEIDEFWPDDDSFSALIPYGESRRTEK